MANSTMAARQEGFKQRKSSSRHANSHLSSTTSSSKHAAQVAVDDPSSSDSSARIKQQYSFSESSGLDSETLKENVTVTVRFRPLSPREIRQGEEIAWYADGETIVRNEHTPSIAYAYDRVFGPTTTTRHVYDIAARHVISGAMEGISGTIFAYGVTSSGKTHTMHGDQRSPGIIPLAVKEAFSIIQETPSREFLLRLSYLEIYNEVVNDLLNPAGQHLRIREDSQGTFVEGIKEEIVLSPAHALSIIAAGEEQRHVGSTNFNLHSSRSHTIFTLTIESSHSGENNEGEAVNLSQLNLIDLAGSESSKAETTGLRRKEGSYINKSLLTLGTVISKLTDGRAAHIPYRDSKLTRLLQSSLSGTGRVSLICAVTPSSSNSEETHNTLKFAHRAKQIEIQAAQNKIVDEKSLIKTYQNEIRSLKKELEQFKRGIVTVPPLKRTGGNDIVILKQKLEEGQVKLQSRLEIEEGKAALESRIQKLTKLILVSTKFSESSRLAHQPAPRRYSFREEELAYLPHRKRDLILDEENIQLCVTLDGGGETNNDALKEDKKIKKPGLLNWLKPRLQAADNQVIQEQLNQKNNECEELQKTIIGLKQQLSDAHDLRNVGTTIHAQHNSKTESLQGELYTETEFTTINDGTDMLLPQAQAPEIEQLKQKVVELTESKEQLEARNKRLAEESSYAKELASAAAVELKVLSEEVTKLMNHNKKLSAELAAQKISPTTMGPTKNGQRNSMHIRQKEQSPTQLEWKRELALSREREMTYEAVLCEKEQRESQLQQTLEESKQREAYLENELANMWILVARLKKSQGAETNMSESSKESPTVDGLEVWNGI